MVADTYIAHISANGHRIQTVSEHLQAVQEGCEVYGTSVGVRYLAGLAGLLHDLGKNTTAFKTYIQDAASHPDTPPRRGSVDHSTAGGRFLYQRYHTTAKTPAERLAVEWVGNCIISHHQGLRDYLNSDLKAPFFERVATKTEGMEEFETAVSTFLTGRSSEQLDRYFEQACQEVERAMDTVRLHKLPPITLALLTKYVFSCLIDADRTDARQFEEGQREPWTTNHRDFFERSYAKLMAKLQTYETNKDSFLAINRWRSNLSRQCEEFSERPPGIYTLSIPTGGGKTLASLRYALKHALGYGKERIVYIVPYTTIIEQNAEEIRRILKEDDLILEHHSNVIEDVDFDVEDYDLRKKRLNLARDNWDRPLIFTTMVQFLNTFYAKGTRNVRRLHRLSNAVLIFDEVQAVPPNCVALFNAALNFLSVFGQTTSILCTATQPTLDFVKNGLRLSQQAEIISNLSEVSQKFKRVVVEDLTDSPLGAADLATFIRKRMEEVHQILVILNTKYAVRKLFLQLEQDLWIKDRQVKLYHLSTNMCAAHRKQVLADVRRDLAAKEVVICVSTPLIEAGVDISFECVIRSLAGLDSVAQAAGRCNRHGRDSMRTVYVIRSLDEVLTNLPEIRIASEITKRVLSEFHLDPDQYGHDLLAPQAMATYFKYYYHQIRSELKYPISDLNKNLFDLLDCNRALFEAYYHRHGMAPKTLSLPSFATTERYFQVIHDVGTSVLVPYNDEAKRLVVTLNGDPMSDDLSELLRKSQQYVVNLSDHAIRSLDRNGLIYPLLHGHVLALRETAYSSQFGVDTEGNGGWGSEFA